MHSKHKNNHKLYTQKKRRTLDKRQDINTKMHNQEKFEKAAPTYYYVQENTFILIISLDFKAQEID